MRQKKMYEQKENSLLTCETQGGTLNWLRIKLKSSSHKNRGGMGGLRNS